MSVREFISYMKNFRKCQKSLECLSKKLGTDKGDSRCDMVSAAEVLTHQDLRALDSAKTKQTPKILAKLFWVV